MTVEHGVPVIASLRRVRDGGVERDRRPWWSDAVVYQVYLRSFADGNGDGIGDLVGLRQRLPYIADLGVDAIWIVPWYPSPLADGGYDVADYCDIAPRYGTLDDADAMLADAHALGLRVIIDLVANHTSEQHPWFETAVRAGPGSPERERYYFRDGAGDGSEPPNNWISAFGGPAWSRVVDAGGVPEQWYLHTFAPAQPDLNWTNPDVVDDFDAILRFWLDRGVDGFRVDAAPAMAKRAGLPDARFDDPAVFDTASWTDSPYWDVDHVHDVFRRWRRLADEYGDRVFVAEAVVNGFDRLVRYLGPDEMQTAFNFDFLKAPWDADELRRVIDATLGAFVPIGLVPTWVLASHDETRLVTRYGRMDTGRCHSSGPRGDVHDDAVGRRRARAAALLMLALPGGAYVYQGEELGLPEVADLPEHLIEDPIWERSGHTVRGRDGCRVPLPWQGDAPPFGFGPPGSEPWLPQPSGWRALTVEAQRDDPDSTLSVYRDALAIRRVEPGFGGLDLRWCDAPPGVLDLRRGADIRCIVNLSPRPVALPPGAEVLVSSAPLVGPDVPTDTALWIRDRRPPVASVVA